MPVLNAESLRNAFALAVGSSTVDVQESLLIRDESYCGRHWKANDYSLTWFAEESQVKFYGPGRSLIYSGPANGFINRQSEQRRAA
jgi:hypothetical protein